MDLFEALVAFPAIIEYHAEFLMACHVTNPLRSPPEALPNPLKFARLRLSRVSLSRGKFTCIIDLRLDGPSVDNAEFFGRDCDFCARTARKRIRTLLTHEVA